MRRAAGLLLATSLALPLAGCFDPPVREAVEAAFDADGGLTVRVATRLEPESLYGSRPRARERLVAVREAARCGDDPWSRQLELLGPAALRRTLAARDGSLREVELVARYADARAVERLLEPSPVSVALSESGPSRQLELQPLRGSRGTLAERREVEGALERFATAAAAYLGALADLYAYLDEAPGRERPVFAEIFSEKGAGEPEAQVPQREKALLDALGLAMGAVHEFLLLEEGRAESLDELSRRVYDPFPAPLTVTVPGRVEEATGFVPDGDGKFRVPSAGLLGALGSLTGRWVRPDPLVELLAAEERPQARVDVDAFLAGGRSVRRRPDAAEVREALEKALAPQPVLRLRWKQAPAAGTAAAPPGR